MGIRIFRSFVTPTIFVASNALGSTTGEARHHQLAISMARKNDDGRSWGMGKEVSLRPQIPLAPFSPDGPPAVRLMVRADDEAVAEVVK